MKRLIFLILVLVIPLLSHAKPLIIGTTAQNPPFNSIADQNDHFYGFDIDIMGEICTRIHEQCKFTPLLFNKLFTELEAGNIDLAIAAIIITPSRQQQFLFSLPYRESSARFMTTQQSSINGPNDIAHKKVGTRLGTPFKELALKVYSDNINVIEVLDIPELMEGLNDQSIDVIFMDAEAAKHWFLNNSNSYKLIGDPIPVGSGYGIMGKKTNAALMSKINQAILLMESDGTYLKIYTRYFSD